jgi:hypothetical protein
MRSRFYFHKRFYGILQTADVKNFAAPVGRACKNGCTAGDNHAKCNGAGRARTIRHSVLLRRLNSKGLGVGYAADRCRPSDGRGMLLAEKSKV